MKTNISLNGDKLNGVRPSGYKGRYGWRNIFDVFIRERKQKQIKKAIKVIAENSFVPVDRSLVVYQPGIQIKTVEIPIPIPTISIKALIMIAIMVLLIFLGLIGFSMYQYINDRINYEERIRFQMIYNIQRTLEPYMEQQKEIMSKVSYLDNIILAHPMYRERVLRKHKNLQTGKEIEHETWK